MGGVGRIVDADAKLLLREPVLQQVQIGVARSHRSCWSLEWERRGIAGCEAVHLAEQHGHTRARWQPLHHPFKVLDRLDVVPATTPVPHGARARLASPQLLRRFVDLCKDFAEPQMEHTLATCVVAVPARCHPPPCVLARTDRRSTIRAMASGTAFALGQQSMAMLK